MCESRHAGKPIPRVTHAANVPTGTRVISFKAVMPLETNNRYGRSEGAQAMGQGAELITSRRRVPSDVTDKLGPHGRPDVGPHTATTYCTAWRVHNHVGERGGTGATVVTGIISAAR
jgi:hypothetical protein